MTKKVYSCDQETYHEELCSALDWIDAEPASTVTVWEGEPVAGKHSEFVNGQCLIEQFQDSATDNYGEFSEGYLVELKPQKVEELEDLIVSWLSKNAEPTHFFRVENITKYEYLVED